LRQVIDFAGVRPFGEAQACRLAKRHGLQNPKEVRDWQVAEKARMLYKKADAAGLAVLIFEAMLIGPAGSAIVNKDDDQLADAARLYKVDTKTLRAAVAKAEEEKAQKKDNATSTGEKSKAKPARK
jgi:2-hydroxychromene-2-carboxylate isomerase